MKAILTAEDMANAIQALREEFGGDKMEDMKKGGKIAWMSKLGYSTMFTEPENPKEWMDWMLTGIPKEKIDVTKGIKQELKAHVLTMVFGYANYLIDTCADMLAEKDVEISFRNDYIFRHADFESFMELHKKAFT
jgi:hypothetical protein